MPTPDAAPMNAAPSFNTTPFGTRGSAAAHPVPSRSHYDVVVVGGRVAGAATAMLMARRGLDVLVVDRAGPETDTLSTHALMRGAVSQLDRWGLLPAVIAAGTPIIRQTVFRYGADETIVDIRPDGGAEGLAAPRRTVLDPIVVDAARTAGAEICHHTSFIDVRRSTSGRVNGVVLDTSGGIREISTDLVVGADGLRSKVARRLRVPVTRRGDAATASILTYVDGVDLRSDQYLWLHQPGLIGGVIPTNDDAFCIFTSVDAPVFARRHRGRNTTTSIETAYAADLEHLAPDVAAAVRAGRRRGPIRSWPGHAGQYRQASGPGWALVGDAGYFKDPAAAHGISDALRDAELLANAVDADDLDGYGPARDELSAGLFDALERVAGMTWSLDELPQHHLALSRAMSAEHHAARDSFECYSATASGLVQPLGM